MATLPQHAIPTPSTTGHRHTLSFPSTNFLEHTLSISSPQRTIPTHKPPASSVWTDAVELQLLDFIR